MMLLDSKQILDAIARSLEGHVLPQLSDDFAFAWQGWLR